MKNLVPVILCISLLFACQQIRHVRILKLAHVLDTAHPVHKGMVYMAEKVNQKSGGKMRVDIYPGGQLGQERDLIELLLIGTSSAMSWILSYENIPQNISAYRVDG